ncbi:hypothetical protein VZT92_002017 [Zoarces viviparus]|uniref:IBB domain-containing protein n=1 Tax=Zoarces viviparus TaxID=48416 RepID=A0AAW1G4C7_ZOAVI
MQSVNFTADKKFEPRASSQQGERYQRQRHRVSKKLSSDELERKRREMMDQAEQREEDRENNLDSAGSSTVEDRVKRNIHSIQRMAVSLDNMKR